MIECKIVNMNKESYDICIGRGTKWGNPYSHLPNSRAEFICTSRNESIMKYKEWILNQPDLMDSLHELRGKILGCYCKPKSCHGDILVSLVNDKFENKVDIL